MRGTRSDGREKINDKMKELQADWDKLVKQMAKAKVNVETLLLQWADYSSSYSQLEQWITDKEAKLQQMTKSPVRLHTNTRNQQTYSTHKKPGIPNEF